MAQDLSGHIIADKYRLDARLREGAESDLYSATHRLMDKPFSIRVLRGSLSADEVERERFFELCRIEAAAGDAGLPKVVDFGTDPDGRIYCIYEAIVGDSLRSVIDHDGQFPVHTSVSIGSQTASALAALHSAGNIHGDLNAENVLLSNDELGEIRPTIIGAGAPNPLLAEKENASPADFSYISPELCSGSDIADERSDIYSIGVLLYEMLAGAPPFSGEKPTDVMLKHIEEMPAPLSSFRSDMPDGLEPIILKAMSKDPAMRQATAAELAEELDSIGTKPEPKAAAATSAFWKTAFMMLIGIGLLAAALIYATRVKQTDPITSLQPDANGQPVQPLNPATGIEERNLASMQGTAGDVNSNLSIPLGTMPGGDGYDPWANAPTLQPPGGTITIPPDSQSPFTMDPGCTMLPSGLVICPTVVPQRSPSPTPRPEQSPTTNTAPRPVISPTPAAPANTPRPTPRATEEPSGPPAAGDEDPKL